MSIDQINSNLMTAVRVRFDIIISQAINPANAAKTRLRYLSSLERWENMVVATSELLRRMFTSCKDKPHACREQSGRSHTSWLFPFRKHILRGHTKTDQDVPKPRVSLIYTLPRDETPLLETPREGCWERFFRPAVSFTRRKPSLSMLTLICAGC